LVAAGSFGKVYKGYWGGREVAIKVIEHDSETAAAVENEVRWRCVRHMAKTVGSVQSCTPARTRDASTADDWNACKHAVEQPVLGRVVQKNPLLLISNAIAQE
jgi:hypothetical protein